MPAGGGGSVNHPFADQESAGSIGFKIVQSAGFVKDRGTDAVRKFHRLTLRSIAQNPAGRRSGGLFRRGSGQDRIDVGGVARFYAMFDGQGEKLLRFRDGAGQASLHVTPVAGPGTGGELQVFAPVADAVVPEPAVPLLDFAVAEAGVHGGGDFVRAGRGDAAAETVSAQPAPW